MLFYQLIPSVAANIPQLLWKISRNLVRFINIFEISRKTMGISRLAQAKPGFVVFDWFKKKKSKAETTNSG